MNIIVVSEGAYLDESFVSNIAIDYISYLQSKTNKDFKPEQAYILFELITGCNMMLHNNKDKN